MRTPSLRFFGRIPTSIKMNNVVGCGEVQAYTTCLPGGFSRNLHRVLLVVSTVPSLQSKDQNSTLWIRGEVIQSLKDLKSWNKNHHEANGILSNTDFHGKKMAAFCLSSELRPPWYSKGLPKIIYTKLISQPTDPFVENFSVRFWCLNPEKCWTKSWAKSCWVSRYCLSCNG